MNDNTRRTSREEWFTLVDEQVEGSLSQKEFCKQRQLSLYRFGYYKKLRATEKIHEKASFTPVAISQHSTPDMSDIKIQLPNGFICHTPIGLSVEKLKQLMGALMSC